MEIKKLKVHKVLTCNQDESVSNIAKLLKKNKDRRVFVVDSSKKLKGIVTTVDLVYKALTQSKTNLKAKDIMTQGIKSVELKDGLGEALHIMDKTKSYVCPVTDKGRIVGVINYHDLVNYLHCSLKK